MLVIETTTYLLAEGIQQQIHNYNCAKAQSQGYTVIGGEIVPKNRKSGTNDLVAMRTKRWDTPHDSGGGLGFYVCDLPEFNPTGVYTRKTIGE